jgi:hypothetical protein
VSGFGQFSFGQSGFGGTPQGIIPAPVFLTQTQIFTALVTILQTFGLATTSGGVIPIIRGQVNRVPEPTQPDFIVLWPVGRSRMAMNEDTYMDTQVLASIAPATSNLPAMMTVTELIAGSVVVGGLVWGAGLPTSGIQITSQTSGTGGGAGIYTLGTSATISSEILYCGTADRDAQIEVTIQCDVHGLPGAGGVAGDNAARIATLFRDQYGVSAFEAQGLPLAPLYTSDPRQLPFDNAEQQSEERWSLDLVMQASIAVTTPQQFADQLSGTAEAVYAVYP